MSPALSDSSSSSCYCSPRGRLTPSVLEELTSKEFSKRPDSIDFLLDSSIMSLSNFPNAMPGHSQKDLIHMYACINRSAYLSYLNNVNAFSDSVLRTKQCAAARWRPKVWKVSMPLGSRKDLTDQCIWGNMSKSVYFLLNDWGHSETLPKDPCCYWSHTAVRRAWCTYFTFRLCIYHYQLYVWEMTRQ